MLILGVVIGFAGALVLCGLLALAALLNWRPLQRLLDRFRFQVLRQLPAGGGHDDQEFEEELDAKFALDALHKAPIGYCVIAPDGSILLSNNAAHKIRLVRHARMDERVQAAVDQVFTSGEPFVDELKLDRGPNRPARIVQVQAVPIFEHEPDDDEDITVSPTYVVVYGTDESEHARMESARRDFVANVSHELKTPVGAIALLAEALLQGKDDPEQVEYFGQKLVAEAHRLGSMITELISLSKLQGAEQLPQLVPIQVRHVMAAAVDRCAANAESHGIEIVTRYDGDNKDPWVLAEDQLLITALVNLITNAINYSPGGLDPDGNPKPNQIIVRCKTVGDVVRLQVRDFGIGIAPKNQQRVFERFYRVDKARSRSTGGTGLGLAIVKHVATNLKAELRLKSELGVGSVFTLEMLSYPRPEKGI